MGVGVGSQLDRNGQIEVPVNLAHPECERNGERWKREIKKRGKSKGKDELPVENLHREVHLFRQDLVQASPLPPSGLITGCQSQPTALPRSLAPSVHSGSATGSACVRRNLFKTSKLIKLYNAITQQVNKTIIQPRLRRTIPRRCTCACTFEDTLSQRLLCKNRSTFRPLER